MDSKELVQESMDRGRRDVLENRPPELEEERQPWRP
jgi:hypothetical protein